MFGNFSLFKTPFLGWSSLSTAFVSLFVFYIFFLPSFKDNGLLFWVPDVLCWHQKLLCGIYSVFKCSFDEFVGEKVVSTSYSSTMFPPVLLPGKSHGLRSLVGYSSWVTKSQTQLSDFISLHFTIFLDSIYMR